MFDRNMTVADLMAEEAAPSCQMDLLSVSDLRMDVAGTTLLDIPSMCITEGGPTVIMGPNGAGKSLLLRVLHGLAVASAGSIRMRGQVLDANLIRRQAMVFQSPVILRRSVRANVEYALAVHGTPRRARRDEAKRLLSIAGLQDRAQQPARSLSGGRKSC